MKFVYRGQDMQSQSFKKPKTQTIIIILLVIALAALVGSKFIGGRSFSSEDVKVKIKNMLNSEMKNAISQAESLGRSGASGSTNIISRVRQHVYALDALNALNISLSGQSSRIFPQQDIDTTMASIDEFFVQLQTGQSVNEVQIKLMDNLAKLDDQLRLWQ